MIRNRSIPASRVIPMLPYEDVEGAVVWLTEAFDFSVRIAMGPHRAQMNAAGGAIVLTHADTSPAPRSVMVRVDDVEAHYARALAAGVRVVTAPQTYPYGERQYSAADPGGHVWCFTQSVADVAPESWGGMSGVLDA